MLLNGFSRISAISASPKASRVRRTRRSNFRAGFSAIPDIGGRFVRFRGLVSPFPLTAVSTAATFRFMPDDRTNPPPTRSTVHDDKLAGLALIAGSLANLVTMALHPTGNDLFRPGMMEFTARLATALHVLALLATPVVFLGTLGLWRRLEAPNRLALAGTVFYGFACLTVTNAATLSGFIAPDAARQVARTDHPELHDAWRVAFHYTGDQNQAYARIFVVAASLALLLWSIAMLKHPDGHAWRRIGIYGCVIAPITIAVTAAGYLRLDVHGFGMVALTEALWFIFSGLELRSTAKS